jgi:ATP-dependent RNA helicase RhlE
VHRIGRTARAGASGESITFCDAEEHKYLLQIEKIIGMEIPIDSDHPFHSADAQDQELGVYRNSPRSKTARGGKRGKPSEPSAARSPSAEPTQRRRSISGKVKKIKPRASSSPQKSFGKRAGPKSKRR